MWVYDIVLRDLLNDARVGFTGKGVYLGSTAIPADSLSELARRLGIPRTTVLHVCRDLSKHGWMELRRSGRRVCPIPLIPHTCQVVLARALEKDFSMVAKRGEFLMKRHLDLRIATGEFFDNARPEFLTNPITDEPLEYDRYYPPSVAFEFNGLQHYVMTRLHRDENELKRIQARDAIKLGLSTKAQVNLVVVRAEDLRPGRFARLVPDSLSQRVVDEKGPYYQTLSRMCVAYANKTEQEMAKILGQNKSS